MTEPKQFLIYQSEDGSTRVDVMLEMETLWLSQKQLTDLFGKAKGTISEHIKHILEDGELDENSVVRFFRTTAADGKQYSDFLISHKVQRHGQGRPKYGGCCLQPYPPYTPASPCQQVGWISASASTETGVKKARKWVC